MNKKFANWIMNHRLMVIGGIVILSVFFSWGARNLEVKSQLDDLLPNNHPYIKIHKQYENQLGSPFKIFLMLEVKDGDIYNSDTLEKIKRITDKLDIIPGVNHDQIYSLGSRKIKKITITEDAIIAEDLMKKVPQSKREMEEFKETVRNTRGVQGMFVSSDEKCALFTASFIQEPADYKVIFRKIGKLIEDESDENCVIYAAGEPLLLGWVYKYEKEMYFIFGVTFLIFLGLLWYHFRNILGVTVQIPPIILGVLWFLGFCGLLGYNLEPLTLVIPVLIIARSISHSVQFTERYFEHYQRLKDVKQACVEAMISIFPPGVLGIITDSLGIFLIAVAPIPMMQKLAFLCGFWAFSIIFTGLLFTPVFISFFPPPKNMPDILDKERGFTHKILRVTAKLGYGRAGVVTLIGTLVIILLAGWITLKVEVGDINSGTPILWEDSDYNNAVSRINRKFPGTDELYVILEGENPKDVEKPEFLKIMNAFQRHMEKIPGVTFSLSIADMIIPIHKYVYGGYPKWQTLPKSREEAGQLFHLLLGRSAPGDYSRYVSGDTRTANVITWYRDHTGDTIRSAISGVKEFIEKNGDILDQVRIKFRLASGNIGVLAAMNETIVKSQFLNFFMVMGSIFLLCSLAFRSIAAALILMVPLNIANLFTLSIMYILGIGLNINTLPVVSVGVGVGIDYGIYLLSRICEEYQHSGEFSPKTSEAAILTTGKAIFFTATSMIFGVIVWYVLSHLRFQAEMGLLLAIIMLVNMMGALILIPALVYFFKPKFLRKVSSLVK